MALLPAFRHFLTHLCHHTSKPTTAIPIIRTLKTLSPLSLSSSPLKPISSSNPHFSSTENTLILKKDERIGLSSEGLNPPDPDVNSSSTIAAIVTSLGGQASAVGIVRLSGPSAVDIAGQVFRPSKRRNKKNFSWQPTSHVVEYGVVCDSNGNVVDEVLVIPMLAPRSYTREDVVELQCHGSDVCLHRVLRACLEAGARLAEPGTGISICKKATAGDKLEMKRLEDVYEEKKAESKGNEVKLPCEAGVGFKKRKGISTPIERAFGVNIRDQLDQEIARMFYTGGLPFNLARNPHYHRAFQFAADNKIDGYVPPGYNKLRTTLLQKEKDNVHRLLEPLRSTWKEKGVTIVSDGWSDPTRKPLINFMATSGNNGPMFLKAVNCFGEVKDRFFIADLMKEVINEIGHQHVVQIITDNAANCKAAGEIIESQFPHIYWTPCVVHTLNLALKNICSPRYVETNSTPYEECKWIKEVHDDALAIKNFIMNHNMRLSIFTKFTPLRLLSVADTRFASIIVMLKRLKLIKRGLQAMVISEEWSSYREDDTVKANFVKEKIVDDEWWDKVSYILSFTGPIYEMIRVCDTDKPCLHLVYEMWDSMIEKVKIEIYNKEKRPLSQLSLFYDVVHAILEARWAKNNTPLHCLAHSLNPRYYSDAWLLEDSIRIAPHRDGEVSQERMKCFRRLFPNDDEYSKVLEEYAMFSMKSGPFEDLTSISKMATMEPKSWWVNFGAQTPFLQTLAFRLLGQPSSSSCAERNWSTYAFIHSFRRNRLTTSRAQDLVYIHNNLRLLSRNPNDDAKMWDVGGDVFDSMEDVGFLEFAELSLDEPAFENDLINDN